MLYIVSQCMQVFPLRKRHFMIYLKHGGEARDLKLQIPGIPPTVRICIALIFSLIMVGFAWNWLQTI